MEFYWFLRIVRREWKDEFEYTTVMHSSNMLERIATSIVESKIGQNHWFTIEYNEKQESPLHSYRHLTSLSFFSSCFQLRNSDNLVAIRKKTKRSWTISICDWLGQWQNSILSDKSVKWHCSCWMYKKNCYDIQPTKSSSGTRLRRIQIFLLMTNSCGKIETPEVKPINSDWHDSRNSSCVVNQSRVLEDVMSREEEDLVLCARMSPFILQNNHALYIRASEKRGREKRQRKISLVR